jgi:hypothetical protein
MHPLIQIKQTLNPFLGLAHKQSHTDCNYLFMLLHEPKIAKIMHGRYTSIMGGCRVAKKETGYSTVRQFIEASDNYIKIEKDMHIIGDIFLFDDSHEVSICAGNVFYGFNSDNIYSVTPIKSMLTNYTIYRKVTK